MSTQISTQVVDHYLKAFYSGDFAAARALVAEDFSFEGPFVKTCTRDAFFASAGPLAQVVRGHRLLHQWADGSDVCSIFELALETPASAGTVLMTEWHRVADDRIASVRTIFDTAQFRAVLPAR